MIEMRAPVEAEPAHISLDGVDIFLLLLGRIGVVEAQVAAAAEFLRHAEIEADRLGVADVQIAVRLRRKAGYHRSVALGVEIRLDDVADEIAPGFRYCRFAHCPSNPNPRGGRRRTPRCIRYPPSRGEGGAYQIRRDPP